MYPLSRMIRDVVRAAATIAFCMSAATAHAENPAATVSKSAVRDVASEMTSLYMSTLAKCPYDNSTDLDPDRPAFLCSGIIIRTATNDAANPPKYYSWSLAPSSVDGTGPQHEGEGGISFSWIRRDTTFIDLGASGYTLYPLFGPYNAHDSSKIVLKVICAYPFDAWTNFRDNKGCGAGTDPNTHQAVPGGGNCQDQGILTYQAWVAHYQGTPAGTHPYFYQCGVDTWTSANRNGKLRNGDAFAIVLNARIAMAYSDANGTFHDRNELRIEDWPLNTSPAALPIQSFYYTAGNAAGRTDAQRSQALYYQLTGKVVPVIQITSPTIPWEGQYDNPAAQHHFAQLEADQVVPH